MTENILALTTEEIVPGTLIVLVMVAFHVFIFALVIICLIRVSRYFLTAGKEQKLIRMEIGKLAEEVHQLRQELKAGRNNNSSPQTG